MKSIIYTGDNPAKVRDGSKTQTRRVVKQSLPTETTGVLWDIFAEYWVATDGVDRLLEPIKSRYGVGDVLYVKEEVYYRPDDGITAYRDGNLKTHATALIGSRVTDGAKVNDDWPNNYRDFGFTKYSPMFMPKHCARTFIEITGIRCERVQDISEDDAKAEGVKESIVLPGDCGSFVSTFAYKWDEIHHKNKQHNWQANPWVFVYEFKRVEL